MKTLTKSLHTVTAVCRVADHLAWERRNYKTATALICDALAVLGYDAAQLSIDDPTVEKIYRECQKIVAYVARVNEENARAAA